MQKTLAVVSQSGQTLSFLDLSSGERTVHLKDLTAEPHELCFDKKRNVLYVSHTYRHGHFWVHGDYSHEISTIDRVSKVYTGSIDVLPALGPHGLALDEQRDILYASVEELRSGKGGGLIGIDLDSKIVIKRIESKSKPHWFVMTPDGRKAYTCNKGQPSISVLDLIEGTPLSMIEIPGCEEPGISPDGKFAYFPTPGLTVGPPPTDACIKVIDTTTDCIIKSSPTGLGAQSVHLTSLNTMMVGKYKYDPRAPAGVLKALPGCLALYSTEPYELLGEVTIGLGPLTMRSTDNGMTAFVANIFSGTVTVIDLTSMTVIRTLDVDLEPDPTKANHQGAHGMAALP